MTDAFEERVSEWMTFFHTYITANFPVVMSTPDDLEVRITLSFTILLSFTFARLLLVQDQ